MDRKLILYIAMSLDGYIAKKDSNIDFLSMVEVPNEDYGYHAFQYQVDTVIWGRKTFDKVLSFGIDIPHKDKNVYVISKSQTGTKEHVVYHNNVVELIKKLKTKEGKDIYCDGGGEIVFELLKNSLIDRLIISVIPHLLGNGIPLFKDGRPEQNIKYKQSISYPSGLVQLWYDVERSEK
ncbi:dihydrofolate reductase family protein [Chondrinema litorale]|uniref:dihydrofolate reductase family protein n=1 Tax=Chondrinema litorale TaxID=2994555 RepID=UPI0025438AB5|nr:dihydrofolate reductase family protein [Chondrinema litorale]UZR96944.1 dihydrofolate reductase family protein [Chondrinema litorale]